MPVTYSFSAGGTISASELNTNFTDVFNEVSGITVADLHTSSGILSTNLSDRYCIVTETIPLTGYYYEHATTTVAEFFLPDETASPGIEVIRKPFTLRPGKSAYLCAVSIHAVDITVATAGAYPVVWVTRNGTVLGGAGAQLQADATTYHLRNTNPIDNPLTSLSNDDYLTVGIGVAASAADTEWSRAAITFTYKFELVG